MDKRAYFDFLHKELTNRGYAVDRYELLAIVNITDKFLKKDKETQDALQ